MAWVDAVLADHIAAIQAARTMEELARVSFDAGSPEILRACHDALNPPDGHVEDHFEGRTEAQLKRFLLGRFKGLKRDRQKELLRGPGAGQSSGPGGAPYYDWTADLIHNKQGKIIGNVANLILMMRHHPDWQGVLAYSEFTGAIIIRQAPPWGAMEPDALWTERDTTRASAWFCRNGMDNPSKDKVLDAVMVVAREQAFHPVRDYLEALAWDGVPRLATWLQTYLGVKDSPYVQAIGPRFLISAVARIYNPGARVDHVLVWEGPQGVRKSTAVKTLAPQPDWVADQLSSVTNKDAKMEVAGIWIIEIPEMEVVTRAGSSATKRFLTNHTDRFRPPYGRSLIAWPRQLVFIGTLNPLPGEGYLKDPTGARRFWPVLCGEIDIAGLARDRDQLWAEAVHLYKAGMPWHLETPELTALATAEQELRRYRDDWELPIEEWVKDKTEVTIIQVMKGALGLALSHSGEIRVAKILKRLGFTQVRPNKKGASRRPCYRREESATATATEPTVETTTEPTRQPKPTRKATRAKRPAKKSKRRIRSRK
jgi:predicted P-loop ATPase